MNLVSPKFLQMCQSKRAKILKCLFEDDDVFSVVMDQKDINFEEACEWIAEEVFDIDLPIASESEVQMMRLAAKGMIDKKTIEPDD